MPPKQALWLRRSSLNSSLLHEVQEDAQRLKGRANKPQKSYAYGQLCSRNSGYTMASPGSSVRTYKRSEAAPKTGIGTMWKFHFHSRDNSQLLPSPFMEAPQNWPSSGSREPPVAIALTYSHSTSVIPPPAQDPHVQYRSRPVTLIMMQRASNTDNVMNAVYLPRISTPYYTTIRGQGYNSSRFPNIQMQDKVFPFICALSMSPYGNFLWSKTQ